MKNLKRLFLLVFCASFLFTTPACVVLHEQDNGRHLGWYKQKKKVGPPAQRGKGKGQRRDKHKDGQR